MDTEVKTPLHRYPFIILGVSTGTPVVDTPCDTNVPASLLIIRFRCRLFCQLLTLQNRCSGSGALRL